MINQKIVRMCTESVRGTTPGAPSWTQLDLQGAGLFINESRSAFEGWFSSTFPRMKKVIKTGKRGEGPLVTPIYIAQAQAILEAGYKRTSGALTSFTIHEKKGSVEERAYTGCVCDQLSIRGGSDDDPVIATLDWRCLGVDSTSGITAGAYPSGTPLMGHKTTISVNSVDITDELDDWEITFANNLIIGPHSAAGFPKYIRDGRQRVGIQLNQAYESNGLTEILRGQDAVAIAISMLTGVGTEEVEFTAAKAHILEAPESGDVGEDMKQSATLVLEEPTGSEYAFAYTTS